MARLLIDFIAIDSETMQEVYVSTEGEIQTKGQIIKYCRGGRHWVPRNDYLDYCWYGYHEYATTIRLSKSISKGRKDINLTKP